MKISPPVCPKCGRAPTKISERAASSGGAFFPAKKSDDASLICTYRCECGTMFTRTEPRGDRGREQPKT